MPKTLAIEVYLNTQSTDIITNLKDPNGNFSFLSLKCFYMIFIGVEAMKLAKTGAFSRPGVAGAALQTAL